MNIDSVREAKDTAVRFLKTVDTLEAKLETDDYAAWGTRESGAVRRSSLDLSRSLSAMRRPG